MTTKAQRIDNMLRWCDQVAVKWTDGGMHKVKPKFGYENHGGYCHFCKPSRPKEYHCNSYLIGAYHHGYGLTDFRKDCQHWGGGGCGGMMRRDFNPAVKKGIFEIVSGISKKHPIYCNTDAQIREANQILRPGDVLLLGKGKSHSICHTAIWYGDGLVTECAGDAGCCIRSAKKLDRGQGRCIVKVYRIKGQKEPKKEEPKKKAKALRKYQVINKKGMNIRSGAGVKYKKLGHIPKGTKVAVSKVRGRWAYVPSLSGWVCIKGRTKRYMKRISK